MASQVPAELRSYFEEQNQGHVFEFLDRGLVPEAEQASFLAQLQDLDLDYVEKSYRSALEEATAGVESAVLEPPDEFTCLAGTAQEDIQRWESTGLAAIGRGEVAACLLAGGQGTRLGFDGPKGCYDIGLPSGKPLFQLLCEKIRRLVGLAKEAGGPKARAPLLIMTSPGNHEDTTSFFAKHKYFGLDEKDVWFFAQGTMPCMTKEGKIILESAGCVALAPDGNGGIYPALQKSGNLDRLEAEGVKYVHIFAVDNPLCRPADPRFVGFCIAKDADCGNKSVWKAGPEEKVGVVAKRNGLSAVVEYSDLDETRKNLRDASGRLVFGAGNICNHFVTVEFLREVVMPKFSTLFHLAHKKIPFAGPDGQTQKPESNNGIKIESFVFDVFPLSSRMAILETRREEEFGPVKNAPGSPTDSPDTARALVNQLSRQWIQAAGGVIEGEETATVEVSPLLSYAGEGLEELVRGKTFKAPIHLE